MDNCPRCQMELRAKLTEYGVLPQCIYCGYEDYARLESPGRKQALARDLRRINIERKSA